MTEQQTESHSKTLGDLLTDLERADNDLIEFTPTLVDDLKDKVDSYKYIDLKFDSEITRLETQIADLAAAKESLKANKAKLREVMAYHMKERGFSKLPGELYQVSLVTRKDVELCPIEASAENYGKYPTLMEMSFRWKVSAVKGLVIADPEKHKGFGTVIEKSHVKFTAKKGLS